MAATFGFCCRCFSHSRNAYDALGLLSQACTPFLAVNFKNAQLPLPAWVKPEDDLYQNAPESVRQEHSLHLIGPDGAETWLELFEQLRVRGALIVVFSDKNREELLQGLKLYLAWYARPGSLRMHLDNGSDNLRRGIMTGVKALLIQPPGDEWMVYQPADEAVPLE